MNNIIKHVAIIMDGNGRWAASRGLPRIEGHKAGAEAVKKAIRASHELGIEFLTLYAFSTENWRRPKNEIKTLFKLLRTFISDNLGELNKNKIRLRVIGRIEELPLYTRSIIKQAILDTEKNTSGQLILALNYGGRTEIVDAVKCIVKDINDGFVEPNSIDEKMLSSYLYAPDVPDPDLLIRTSGEFRLSNFLLWEASYSEIVILDTLWPDFSENDFYGAIKEFKKRKRRFGGV